MKAFVAGASRCNWLPNRRRIGCKRGIPVRALVRNLDTARQILPPEVGSVTGDVCFDRLLWAMPSATYGVAVRDGAKHWF